MLYTNIMTTCKVDNCDRQHYAKGYCMRHYSHILIHGKILKVNRGRKIRFCKVENCNREHRAFGYCSKHYQQVKKYGRIKVSLKDPNEIILDQDIARISIYNKNGDKCAEAIVDATFYHKIRKYRWGLASGYAIASLGNGKKSFLHNVVLNTKPSNHVFEVDHINRDKLDNRRSNLRICTKTQNNVNSAIRSDNTSGVKGVSWSQKYEKWHAYLHLNGKRRLSRYFKEFLEAVEARRQAEIVYFKEFAPIDSP